MTVASKRSTFWPFVPGFRRLFAGNGVRRMIVSIAVIGAVGIGVMYSLRPALPRRVANEVVHFPLAPPNASGWAMENCFPNLKFFEPTSVAVARDGSNRVFVLERRGTIQLFENDSQAATTRELIDFSSRVVRTPYDDDGALGLVLHPEFGQANSSNREYLFVFYTADVAGKCFDRLSRFAVGDGDAIDPQSELVLIDQFDESVWHNGGALAFGPDGFLYVGVGDEGGKGDGLSNGQKINRDLFSGILRIDVDRRGGDVSHPPRRQPATGKTSHYFIPNDNPFVDVPDALEEFWAIGLRNPHRISFDPDTNNLWVGDVGQMLREEINIASRGSNHGWSYAEGRLPFNESYLDGKKPSPFFGTETHPVYSYPHLNGNNCVIGGHVYRGDKHPKLRGKYIYADNGSGSIFALDYDGKKVKSNRQITALPFNSKTGISTVELDADGELWIAVLGNADEVDGTIHRLVASEHGASDTLPRRLSETALFDDLKTLSPASGVVPYDVNVRPWSDGAIKRQWIMLPGDGTDPDTSLDRIKFAEAGEWEFPTGTIFVEHFELPIDEMDDGVTKRLETRVLVRDETGGVYGFTYKWNDEGTDALLLDDTMLETVVVRTKDGGERKQVWHYPGRQSCIVCHNNNTGGVLGVNARQLNRDYRFPQSGKTANQLVEWNRAGMFAKPHDKQNLLAAPRLTPVGDAAASLDSRARSYLDVNCSSCHRPGGARANFDARFDTPLDLQNLVDGKANHTNPLLTSTGVTSDGASLDRTHALDTLPAQGDFGLSAARLLAPGDPYRSTLLYRMATVGQGRMPHLGSREVDRQGLSLLVQWAASLTGNLPSEGSVDLASLRSSQIECLARLQRRRKDDAGVQEDIHSLLSTTSGALLLAHALWNIELPADVASQVVKIGSTHDNERLRGLFEAFVPPENRSRRVGPVANMEEILAIKGNATLGRRLMLESSSLQCISCHRVFEQGISIGPDLTHIAKKNDRRQILESLVQPSKKIDPKFQSCVVYTNSGRVLQGLLASQTDEQVVLTDKQGKSLRIAADDIDEIERVATSLMPEQLLQALTYQEAADLLAFLSELK